MKHVGEDEMEAKDTELRQVWFVGNDQESGRKQME